MLYIKQSKPNMQGRENYLGQRTNSIHGTHTKEAVLTRFTPIPGNNLKMEMQCCSWWCTSKPGKPQV